MGRTVQRIVILGGAGSGKSTLARELGSWLALPIAHLDRLYYGPDWTPVGAAVFRARVKEAVAGERWVVEGTYRDAAPFSLPRADLVVWLERPAALRLWRCWRKTRRHSGQPRADRPDDCPEAFSLRYAMTVLSFGAWTPIVEASVRNLARGAQVTCLRSDAEVRALAERLGPRMGDPSPDQARETPPPRAAGLSGREQPPPEPAPPARPGQGP